MRKIIGFSCGIVLCLCLSIYPDVANAIENEVWISPIGPDVTNVNQVDYYPTNIVGTPTYPFRCSDGSSLNTVLTSVLTGNNMTIHFMAGTFSLAYNSGT